MHTCEIIVRNYGYDPEDLCGLPATKSVVRYTLASGESCEGYLAWLCDEHYENASANWKKCDF